MDSSEKLIIFDTTLRDGEQSPGASMTKDEKLAFPLGLRECGADACPEMAESQTANLSAELLRSKNFGQTSLHEIETKLASMGLALRK